MKLYATKNKKNEESLIAISRKWDMIIHTAGILMRNGNPWMRARVWRWLDIVKNQIVDASAGSAIEQVCANFSYNVPAGIRRYSDVEEVMAALGKFAYGTSPADVILKVERNFSLSGHRLDLNFLDIGASVLVEHLSKQHKWIYQILEAQGSSYNPKFLDWMEAVLTMDKQSHRINLRKFFWTDSANCRLELQIVKYVDLCDVDLCIRSKYQDKVVCVPFARGSDVVRAKKNAVRLINMIRNNPKTLL